MPFNTLLQIRQTIFNKVNHDRDYPIILERELDRIRKSDQKYGVDVLSSCLAVTSMALHICTRDFGL